MNNSDRALEIAKVRVFVTGRPCEVWTLDGRFYQASAQAPIGAWVLTVVRPAGTISHG